MDRGVHYELTRIWALEAGFSPDEATAIAAADWDVDRVHNVYASWHNKGYHFAWLGASRRAKSLLERAIAGRDLVLLGEALHCSQDAIGHGQLGHLVHWDGIDRWDERSERVRRRIERRSREMLARYHQSL